MHSVSVVAVVQVIVVTCASDDCSSISVPPEEIKTAVSLWIGLVATRASDRHVFISVLVDKQSQNVGSFHVCYIDEYAV
jgi:hypothetical protein